jgi:hypothetical protein
LIGLSKQCIAAMSNEVTAIWVTVSAGKMLRVGLVMGIRRKVNA